MNQAAKSVFRVMIDAPIERVWKELTRTDKPRPFFWNSRCETPGLEPGAPIRMRSANGKYTAVTGTVVEIEPPYRYSHTFKFTGFDDPECRVTYELREVDGQTEFTLINENVPAGTKTEKYMTQGGAFITENLKAILETGRPTFGGRFILLMIKLTEWMTPAKSKSENWPL